MGAPTSASADPAHICECGHLATTHADPTTGDTRCRAVEARNDLFDVFDDGRANQHGCCACLHYVPAATPAAEHAELSDYWSGLAAGRRAAARGVAEGVLRAPPGEPPVSAPVTRLYVVAVDDRCQPQLVGHGGCSYASPPQPADQALALVRALLGCRLDELDVGHSPWRHAIAGGTRTITLRGASPDHQEG